MRFLSRSRKAVNGTINNDGPETMIDAWKREVNREESPQQHCLSFLTKGRKKTMLDADYVQSGSPDKFAGVAATSGEIGRLGGDEVREQYPMEMLEIKEETLILVSKASYPAGNLLWDKAEEKLQFWTTQGTEESVHLSIIVLDRMMEEHEKATTWSDSQMMYWLKAVIQNWNQGQRENEFSTFTPKDMIEQVEAWDTCIQLDPEVYSMIIDGAAFTQPFLADCLLRRTVETQRKGLIYSHTYNQVIRAWVDGGDPYQAQSLLEFMLGEWRNRRDGGVAIAAKPNRQSFHWVLLGWANSNESVAAERTESILKNMQSYSQSGALSGIKPNLDTYKWVMDCLLKGSKGRSGENADRAQGILEALQDKADRGDEDFRPTVEMYSVVVAAWGEAGDPDRGEELLHQLYKDYSEREHDKRLQPNLDIFNNLLVGWSKVPSKSQRKKAGERAESILNHMDKLASSGVLPCVKPDLKSYNTVLDCWSRCGDGAKAQELLERMIDRWEAGDAVVAPDTVSYSRVLSAWNKDGNHERCEYITNVLLKQFHDLGNYRVHPNLILCGLAKFGTQPEALRKAKMLFQKCEDLTRSGERAGVKPNRTSYQHLLECVCKADRLHSGTHAEEILNEMLDKYAAGDGEVKPTVKIYNLVIQALVKAQEPKRTEEVLARMYAEDTRGARVYPDLETFNTILLAWARSGLGDEASKRGEQILRRLERIHESRILQNVKPDIHSYNHVLNCLAQTPDQPNAGERSEALLVRMQQHGVEPNAATYNRVIMALKHSGDTKRAKQLLNSLKRKSFARDDESGAEADGSVQWF